MTSNDDLRSATSQYYSTRLAENGASSKGVDWNGNDSHQLRHFQFLRLIGNERTASILDLGCGYGDFLSFLRSHGISGRYFGLDVSSAMIDAARQLHGEGENHEWLVGHLPPAQEDFAIASGVLNVKGAAPDYIWLNYIYEVIDILSKNSRKGFAFNVLSALSDPAKRRSDLYYASPVAMLDFCSKMYGKNVALMHDYGLYEFTMVVRHER